MKTLYLSLCLFIAGCVSAQVSLSTSLTACYSLNGNANDPINNLTGTLSAVTPTVDRFSNPNSAYAFNGSPTSFIQLPNNSLIKPNAISFSCWTKTNLTNASQYVLYTNNTCVNYYEGYALAYVNIGPNAYRFQVVKSNASCSSSGQIVLYGNTTTLTANSWIHVGFYMGPDSMKLYVNGALDGAIANPNPIVYNSAKNVYLGGTNQSPNLPLNGSIDNVRFYNRKLTNTEFNQLYTLDPACLAAPVASFSVSSSSVCPNQSITLTNLSTNTPTAYAWQMAGGTPSVSTVANPTVSYASPGTYTISLVASNASGSSAPYTQTISVNSCPLGNLSLSLTACYALDGNGSEPINNLTGTLSAVTPTVNRFSTPNSAYAFNGTPTSFIQLPNSSLIKSNAVSFSCWTKTNITNASQYIVFTTNGCFSYYEGYECAYVNVGPNAYRFQVVKSYSTCSSGGQIALNGNTTTITANSWNRVGFYAGPDSLKLYVNGVLDGAMANSNPLVYSPTANVYLGGTNQSPNLPLNGSIDNARFYNRKLTNAEFNQLYMLDPTCLPAPVASFSVSASNVCVNQSIALTNLSANTPTAYAWQMTGGTPSVSTVANPNVTYATPGTYTISLVASNAYGSSAPDTQTVSVSPCTFIAKNTLNEKFFVYPNPNNGEFSISGLEKGTVIQVYNTLGALVYFATAETDKEKINLTTQANGLYIVKFIAEGKTVTTKVIKE